MKIEIAGIYWPQANIGNFYFISFFLLTYLRSSEVDFFSGKHQDSRENKTRKLTVMIKKHPSSWYNIHDVSRGSMSYWWIVWNFRTRGTQRLSSVKFVGRSKYCLEISQTWERLACSHILYSLFKDRRARVWKSKSRGFIDRKRILGIFLGIKGNSNYSLSSEEVCRAWLAMKSSTAVSLPRLTNPAISRMRQVQTSDRINLDRQSGSDQLGSTRTNSIK